MNDLDGILAELKRQNSFLISVHEANSDAIGFPAGAHACPEKIEQDRYRAQASMQYPRYTQFLPHTAENQNREAIMGKYDAFVTGRGPACLMIFAFTRQTSLQHKPS